MQDELTIQRHIFKNPTDSGWIFLLYRNSKIATIRFQYMHLNQGFNLTEFFVEPKYRNKGFGKALVENAIKFINQKYEDKKIYLNVETNNRSALKIYTEIGFKITNSYNTTNKRILSMEYGR